MALGEFGQTARDSSEKLWTIHRRPQETPLEFRRPNRG